MAYKEDRGFDPMTNWEKDCITSEMEITQDVTVRQTKVDCDWCHKKWLVIVDKHVEASGVMLCSNCGKFFRWTVHHEQDVAHTRRVIPKTPKGVLDYG